MTVIVKRNGRWAQVDYKDQQAVTNLAVEQAMVNAGFADWAPGFGPAVKVVVNAYNYSDVVYFSREFDRSSNGGNLDMQGPLVLESPISLNVAKLGMNGNSQLIQGGNITGNNKAITLTYDNQDYNGYKRGNEAPFRLHNFTLLGPGRNASADLVSGAGTSAFYFNADVSQSVNRAIRPQLDFLTISGWDHGVDGKDGCYLGSINDTNFYDCRVGFRQRSGTDSGENFRIRGGRMSRVELALWLQGQHTQLNVTDLSWDYLIQLFLMQPDPGSWAQLIFTNLHAETRGSEGAVDPGFSVALGTGSDARCVNPAYDYWGDISGTGSLVKFQNGSIDLNATGDTPPPWGFTALFNARDIHSTIIIDDVSPQSLANTNQLLKTGPGRIFCKWAAPQFPQALTLPSRLSDQSFENHAYNGGLDTGILNDNLTISQDTMPIVDRLNGANLSLSRDTVTKVGATGGSLKVTKVGAIGTRAQVSTFHGAKPGNMATIQVQAFIPAAGGMAGVIAVKYRWTKLGANKLALLPKATYTVPGVYNVIFISSSAYLLVDPAGATVGSGRAGTAYAGAGLGFTITSAGAAFSEGDGFTITVSAGLLAVGAAVAGNTGGGSIGAVTTNPGDGGFSRAQFVIPSRGAPDADNSGDWDLGFARSTADVVSIDLAATTGVWQSANLGISGGATPSAEMVCPDWADALEEIYSLTNAGPGIAYFDLSRVSLV